MKYSKKDIRDIKKWCKALRSGKYFQGIGQLQSEDGYCCLGVACKVLVPKTKLEYIGNSIGGFMPQDQPSSPYWLLDVDFDIRELTSRYLADLNDSGNFNFDEIADIIEAVCILEVLE